MSRRETKKANTKSSIVEVATKMFLNQTYDQVKLSEISAQVGIAEGTLYNYFPDKSSLFLAVFANLVTINKPHLINEKLLSIDDYIDHIIKVLNYYLYIEDEKFKRLYQTFYHTVKSRLLVHDFSLYNKLEDLSFYIYKEINIGLEQFFNPREAELTFQIIRNQINAIYDEHMYNLISFEAFLDKVKESLRFVLIRN